MMFAAAIGMIILQQPLRRWHTMEDKRQLYRRAAPGFFHMRFRLRNDAFEITTKYKLDFIS